MSVEGGREGNLGYKRVSEIWTQILYKMYQSMWLEGLRRRGGLLNTLVKEFCVLCGLSRIKVDTRFLFVYCVCVRVSHRLCGCGKGTKKMFPHG